MIKQVIGYNAKHLELLETICIYLIFYVSLLEPYNSQELEWPIQELPWLIKIDSEEEWEVEAILDS